MNVVCTRQCFWREKRWNPGDIAIVAKGESFPRHFEIEGETTDTAALAKSDDAPKKRRIRIDPEPGSAGCKTQTE